MSVQPVIIDASKSLRSSKSASMKAVCVFACIRCEFAELWNNDDYNEAVCYDDTATTSTLMPPVSERGIHLE